MCADLMFSRNDRKISCPKTYRRHGRRHAGIGPHLPKSTWWTRSIPACEGTRLGAPCLRVDYDSAYTGEFFLVALTHRKKYSFWNFGYRRHIEPQKHGAS